MTSMHRLVPFIGAAACLLIFLLPGLGAVPYHGSVGSWLRKVVRFSIAYVYCGSYCTGVLIWHLVTLGKTPIVFQYTEYLNRYCTVLAACAYATEDKREDQGYRRVFDGRYMIVKTFYQVYPVVTLKGL